MSDIPRRLHWACRRGMLELDILLGKFLNQAYRHLSQQDQQLFVQLLSCNDQQLFEWLTDKSKPIDPAIRSIVIKVREHAKNSH